MKIKTIIFLVFVLVGILPYVGAATPGIDVTASPLSIATSSGTTIDYQITITNLDNDYDKTITSLGMTISQPGWTYTFEPDLIGTKIPAGNGNSITATLHVTIPPSQTIQIYDNQVTADAEYELFPGFFGSDSDPENFNTEITATTGTDIPEFPTIALPIVSVLGLMFLISRQKKNLNS